MEVSSLFQNGGNTVMPAVEVMFSFQKEAHDGYWYIVK
jgi:hypothetical protein